MLNRNFSGIERISSGIHSSIRWVSAGYPPSGQRVFHSGFCLKWVWKGEDFRGPNSRFTTYYFKDLDLKKTQFFHNNSSHPWVSPPPWWPSLYTPDHVCSDILLWHKLWKIISEKRSWYTMPSSTSSTLLDLLLNRQSRGVRSNQGNYLLNADSLRNPT